MSLGLVGHKIGMTRIFTEEGSAIPVSVIEVTPNHITQIKTLETDGYHAIQVSIGKRKINRVTKPLVGHYAKAKVEPGVCLKEFRLETTENLPFELKLGETLSLQQFEKISFVDVVGTSKGKGFAGGVKRHNFRTQDATHGNSISHRVIGSIGKRQTPGRVEKNKKMPGHLGNERITVQNLPIIKIDLDKNLILVGGSIPGAPNGRVIIYPAVKKSSLQKKEGKE